MLSPSALYCLRALSHLNDLANSVYAYVSKFPKMLAYAELLVFFSILDVSIAYS